MIYVEDVSKTTYLALEYNDPGSLSRIIYISDSFSVNCISHRYIMSLNKSMRNVVEVSLNEKPPQNYSKV